MKWLTITEKTNYGRRKDSFPRRWISFIPAMLMLLTACEYEFPSTETDYLSGTLDLSSYVAVGDDYLAGFMDGALYTEGQQHSVSAF